MNLPINIEKLIKGEVVETERIKYKSGWNPKDVIHSMCTFANDINNLGGYIVIGVEEKDGVP
jgi:ATP-dependent DNA helicase RecG